MSHGHHFPKDADCPICHPVSEANEVSGANAPSVPAPETPTWFQCRCGMTATTVLSKGYCRDCGTRTDWGRSRPAPPAEEGTLREAARAVCDLPEGALSPLWRARIADLRAALTPAPTNPRSAPGDLTREQLLARVADLECRPLVLLTQRETLVDALVEAQVCDRAEAERRALARYPGGAE